MSRLTSIRGRGDTKLFQTSEHGATRKIRDDVKLDVGGCLEINGVVLHLSCCARRAEEKLLTNERLISEPSVRRNSQDELLEPLLFRILEDQMNQPDGLRLIEDQPDPLLTWPRRSPTYTAILDQRRLYGMLESLGREFNLSDVYHG